MINMDDPQHLQAAPPWSAAALRRAASRITRPRVREVCRELVARAKKKETFDFVREVAAPLPMIMIGDMLGVRAEDHDRLLRWSDD